MGLAANARVKCWLWPCLVADGQIPWLPSPSPSSRLLLPELRLVPEDNFPAMVHRGCLKQNKRASTRYNKPQTNLRATFVCVRACLMRVCVPCVCVCMCMCVCVREREMRERERAHAKIFVVYVCCMCKRVCVQFVCVCECARVVCV